MRADGEERTARAGQWLICFGRKIEQRFAPGTRLLSLRILQGWPDGSPLYSGSPLHLLKAARYPRLEALAWPLLGVAGKVSLEEIGRNFDPRFSFLWRSRLDYPSYLVYEGRLAAWLAELGRILIEEGGAMQVPNHADPASRGRFTSSTGFPPPAPILRRTCAASAA
ncbi:MAG: hypothetical protein WDO13_08050 [Verrucomicrobiota bacterium]